MSDVKVIGFQREYPSINLELMKSDERAYDMAILAVYILELKRGFIVKKQYKTNKKGTKFKYKICEDEEEAKEYGLKVSGLLNQYKEKYKTKMELSDFRVIARHKIDDKARAEEVKREKDSRKNKKI